MRTTTKTTFDRQIFAGDAAAEAVIDRLTTAGTPLNVSALEAAYKASSGPDADVIKRMIWAARAGKPAGAKNAVAVQIEGAEVKSRGQQFAEQVRGILDKNIVGQADAKQALVTALRASPPGRASRPSVLVMTGPSGVGKTEMAKAITKALHGDSAEPVVLEGAMFKNAADMSLLEGSPPGYVGSDRTEDISPLSEKNIERCLGGKKPIVLLLDEVDDISPACRSDFWSKMNKAIDEGYFKLKDGKKIDLAGAVIIITSNAGLKTVGAKTGEARVEHFAKEFEAAIGEPKIMNRIGRSNIVACTNLSKSDLRSIVSERFLTPYMRQVAKEMRVEKGVELNISIDAAALDYAIELGYSDETGARNARQIVDKILQPLILDAAEMAEDEDGITLKLKPDLSEVEKAKLIARFQKANGLPPDVNVESSPFVAVTKSINKRFFAYEGKVPSSDIAPPIVHASGLLAGRGFLLFNAGETESLNELRLLQPGPTDAGDTFKSVALPAPLADANFALDATPFGEYGLFVRSMSIDEAADEPVSHFYRYDAVKKAFTACAQLPVALVGSTMTAVGDKVLVTGGRIVERDADGSWSVHVAAADDEADAHHDNTKPIENTAWLYDAATDSWDALEAAPSAGRCGAAAVALDGKVYLMGGEEIAKHPSGTHYSRASRAVDVFDPVTRTFTSGPELASEVAHAKAFVDEHGRVTLAGGVEILEAGATLSAKDNFAQLSPQATTPVWKSKRALPAPGAKLAVIPRLDGAIVGPFVSDDGVQWTKLK